MLKQIVRQQTERELDMTESEEFIEDRHKEDSSKAGTRGRRTSRAKDGLIIAALAAGATHSEAGRAAQVSERTVRRRLESPNFQELLHEAEAEFLGQVSKRLTGLAPTAVETLASLMTSPDVTDQVKLRACLGVLTTTRVWREATEMENRLRDLENQVADPYEEPSR